MNSALLLARQRMRGQKVNVQARQFDNSPWPEGRHTCRIVESEVREVELKGEKHPVLYMRITGEVGDIKGRSKFPFKPMLDDLRGIESASQTLRAILGDVVPGVENAQGGYDVDVDKFLASVEDLAGRCIGELVEVSVRQKTKGTNLKDKDGNPYQNVYINRGLGDDAKGVPEAAGDDESHVRESGPSLGRKAAPRKVPPRRPARR